MIAKLPLDRLVIINLTRLTGGMCMKVRFKSKVTRGFLFSPLCGSLAAQEKLLGPEGRHKQMNRKKEGSPYCNVFLPVLSHFHLSPNQISVFQLDPIRLGLSVPLHHHLSHQLFRDTAFPYRKKNSARAKNRGVRIVQQWDTSQTVGVSSLRNLNFETVVSRRLSH